MELESHDIPGLFDLTARLAEQIERHHVPGAAISVLWDGRIYSAAAGYANVPAGIEADTRTVFQIGSITKIFLTTLALILVEDGLVDLDAPVIRYLPDLRIAHAPCPECITLRMLLNHTCGIDSDLFEEFGTGDEALGRYVRACEQLSLIHAPGKFRSYSNSATCIAGRLLEVAAGIPFNRLLTERVLRPIRIKHFSFFDVNTLRFRTALGHHWDDAMQAYGLPDPLCLPACMSPAGSVLSMTADDLLRFGRMHLSDGLTEDGKRLLSPAGVKAMQLPNDDIPPSSSRLRLGWASTASDRGEFILASGAAKEQNSFLVIHPSSGFGISLLTNTTGGGDRILFDLGRRIIRECTGAELTIRSRAAEDLDITRTEVSDFDTQGFEGVYGIGTTRLTITRVGRELHLNVRHSWSNSDWPQEEHAVLVPLSDRLFVPISKKDPRSRVILEFLVDGSAGEAPTHISCLVTASTLAPLSGPTHERPHNRDEQPGKLDRDPCVLVCAGKVVRLPIVGDRRTGHSIRRDARAGIKRTAHALRRALRAEHGRHRLNPSCCAHI